MPNTDVDLVLEEVGRHMNLTLMATVNVDYWSGQKQTMYEPECSSGYELCDTKVNSFYYKNKKVERTRFPKLFNALDLLAHEMIEERTELVEKEIITEPDYPEWDD